MKVELPVYECDVCQKIGTETVRENEWFDVRRANDWQDVCSPDCLVKLGRQVKGLESGAIPVPARTQPASNGRKTAPNTEPCPVCGVVKATRQGQGAHVYRAHNLHKNGSGEYVARTV